MEWLIDNFIWLGALAVFVAFMARPLKRHIDRLERMTPAESEEENASRMGR